MYNKLASGVLGASLGRSRRSWVIFSGFPIYSAVLYLVSQFLYGFIRFGGTFRTSNRSVAAAPSRRETYFRSVATAPSRGAPYLPLGRFAPSRGAHGPPGVLVG